MHPKVLVGGLATTLILVAIIVGISGIVSKQTSASTTASQSQPALTGPVSTPSPVAAAALPPAANTAIASPMTPILPAGALSQQEVETRIVVRANEGIFHAHLEGSPSAVRSRLMTYGEFVARFDPGASDPTPLDTPYWFVVIKGNVTIAGAPRQDGRDPSIHVDHLWVLVDTTGKVRGTGTFGTSADLDKELARPAPAWTPLPPMTVPKSLAKPSTVVTLILRDPTAWTRPPQRSLEQRTALQLLLATERRSARTSAGSTRMAMSTWSHKSSR